MTRSSRSTPPIVDVPPALIGGALCLGLGVMAAAQAVHGHNHDLVVFSLYAVPLLIAATYLLVVRVQIRPEATAPFPMVVGIAVFGLSTMATQHMMPTWLWWGLALVISQGIGWMALWANQQVAARCRSSGTDGTPSPQRSV